MDSAHPASNLRADLRAAALCFPEAYEEYPWGQVVIKVRRRVFLFLDGDPRDPALHLTIKLPHSGEDVLSLPFASPAGYGLAKAGWVSFHIQPGEEPPLALFQPWIAESYRTVAPRRLVRQLEASPIKLG